MVDTGQATRVRAPSPSRQASTTVGSTRSCEDIDTLQEAMPQPRRKPIAVQSNCWRPKLAN